MFNFNRNNKKTNELYKLRKTSDSSDILICPVCQRTMAKVFLQELNFNVDICAEGCGGIFFDNREFEKIRTPDINISTITNIEKKQISSVTLSNLPKSCPACNTKMIKTFIGKDRIEIDVCPVCGGKFLDSNELELIRAAYLGNYEKSIVEFAIKNQKEFAVICSQVINQSNSL